MKYGSSSGGDSEVLGMPVDSLLLSNCWSTDHFIVDSNPKNFLGDDSEEEPESKGIDELELLLQPESNEQNNNLAELKPLPPFGHYTANLQINGISGQHFGAIGRPEPGPRIETNNNTSETTNQNMYYDNNAVVTSSTMDCMDIKPEIPDYASILNAPDMEDIAAIIGSAIADTTVNGNNNNGDNSRDSWMDLDAWIEGACENSASTSKNGHMSVLSSNESLSDFVAANSQFSISSTPVIHFPVKRENASSTFPHMPLLQSRLQNGPPKSEISYSLVPECTSPSSSTQYIAHSPQHVVSTSDLARPYNPVHSSTRPSPEMILHTTTPTPNKKPRQRTKKPVPPSSTIVYDPSSLGGKEKPVHRCNICNRGFLNKSNIKVHLRTHTGEKPFRCDVCGKAFRQKAHLIKHAQIHKRIGRD